MIDLGPMFPLGAEVVGATINGKAAEATLVAHSQDCHARLRMTTGAGRITHARIAYADGVDIIPETAPLVVGIRSRTPIIAGVAMPGIPRASTHGSRRKAAPMSSLSHTVHRSASSAER